MTDEIIIRNPSEKVKDFFNIMKKRKETSLKEMSKRDSGIFTIEV